MTGIAQPMRAELAGHERLTIVSNAVTEPLLARLRDAGSSGATFSEAAETLAHLLLYEAGKDLPLEPGTVMGFTGEAVAVRRLSARLAAVLILRAGLALAPAFRGLFIDCPIYQIGLRRDEETLKPSTYADNLPSSGDWTDVVFLMDPMVATGGSVIAAIDLLRRSHRGDIVVVSFVSAPYGVAAVFEHDSATRIVTLALDDRLNDAGYIVPGLGDAGDRFFGTT
jgi:uracil phosphoribosyltransferase